MWGGNRIMVIRLFLSLLALLSGLSAAQAANPARSAQSAIGASAIVAASAVALDAVAWKSAGQATYVEQPKPVVLVLQSRYHLTIFAFAPAPRTYASDRSRQ
jgi:hypothetical protein